MRQVKIGEWPAMSVAAAVAAWETLRAKRDAVDDAAVARQAAREAARLKAAEVDEKRRLATLTVGRLCNECVEERVEGNRAAKGSKEVRRLFDTMLGPLAEMGTCAVTPANAFDLTNSYLHIPVQAARLSAELGAASDFELDAGRLPPSTPNLWRLSVSSCAESCAAKAGIQGTRELRKRVLDEDRDRNTLALVA